MQHDQPIYILNGPTASGKSAMALAIAQCADIVIINCDSKQIYQQIPIITAQPSPEELARTEHKLYGCVDVSTHCSVADWTHMAIRAINEVLKDGRIPFLVGGTGMYIKSLTHGISPIPDIEDDIRSNTKHMLADMGNHAFYQELAKLDPQAAQKLNAGDSQRITRAMEVIKQTGKSITYWQSQPAEPFFPNSQFELFFLDAGREETYQHCHTRFATMIHHGVIEEIEQLKSKNLDPALPSMKAHGVPEIIAYLQQEMSLDDATDQAVKNTRHYIKRQYTWARNQMPDATWLTPQDHQIIVDSISQ